MRKISYFLLAALLLLCSCDMGEVKDESYVLDDFSEEIEAYIPNNDVFGVPFAPNADCNPYTSANQINSELMNLICEPLFSLTNTFQPENVLCSEYSYENKIYTIKLKSGVTFSDGSKLTAADVKYSFDCAMNPSSFYATRLAVIENVGFNNRSQTVTIKLKYDNSRLPSLLDFPIVKKDTANNKLPLGTGIYAPNSKLDTLTARENHHSGKTPAYNTISLCSVSSSDELLYKFETHDVSIISNDPTGNSPFRVSSAIDARNVPTTQMHYLGFNTKHPALSDPAARIAIARAIDRENAATSDFALMGHAAALPWHPLNPAYPNEFAENLAFDANTPINISEPLTILVNSENSGKLAVCKRISEKLTQLGVQTSVRALPFEEYTLALQSGDFTLYYAEISLGADFDITRLISGSLNFGGFEDIPLIEANIAALSADESRNDFFKRFCETVPFAPIFFKDTTVYTEKGFFSTAYPTSHNLYYNFCDWKIGG